MAPLVSKMGSIADIESIVVDTKAAAHSKTASMRLLH